MFTGIIESIGVLESKERVDSNVELIFKCAFTNELKIDQSVAHNGVCLTVVEIHGDNYRVVAIDETLQKTNIGSLEKGSLVNLERCMKLGARLDGHMVQGHVDIKGQCIGVEDKNGSWEFRFKHNHPNYFTVPKGSITINGVSLTVVESADSEFTVCIIPFTFEETTFKGLQVGGEVNLEFDIIGKYLDQYAQVYAKRFEKQ
jgi:riboflavin synthase